MSSEYQYDEPTHGEQREDMLRAAEQRVQEHPAPDIRQIHHIHDLKQQFRRLIEPGITRGNNHETAILAFKTLETLSDNLLRDPRNEKFRSFKPTNPAIKKRLVDVKGALEYAVALGFHLKVEKFQPLYRFNDRHLEELQIGNEILKETLAREAERAEKAAHSRQLSVKEQQELARQKVALQFHEDRLEKKEKDRREAELRASREASAATPERPTLPPGGMSLSGRVEPPAPTDGPARRTPYEDNEDE